MQGIRWFSVPQYAEILLNTFLGFCESGLRDAGTPHKPKIYRRIFFSMPFWGFAIQDFAMQELCQFSVPQNIETRNTSVPISLNSFLGFRDLGLCDARNPPVLYPSKTPKPFRDFAIWDFGSLAATILGPSDSHCIYFGGLWVLLLQLIV
jgi:hypothetical protein